MATAPEGMDEHVMTEGGRNSAAALAHLTDLADDHSAPPTSHIHADADVPETPSWMKRHFPHPKVLSKVEEFESKIHFGNFVIDRQTGQKSWEAMSAYVRIGMHLLYVSPSFFPRSAS
jgi:phosphatidylserine decarboxylase